MKLYAKIKLKREIELLRRRGITEVPLSELARKLSKKYGVPVSRAYIKWYCDSRHIPTYTPIKKTNACVYCGKSVNVNGKDRPYNKHKKCELEATLVFITCANPSCGKEFQRSPSMVNEGNNYCNYDCFRQHRKEITRQREKETSPV
jgi:hypothetical protein